MGLIWACFSILRGTGWGVSSDTFNFVRCKVCDLVYLNPRVTPESVGVFYPEHYLSSRPGRDVKRKAKADRVVDRKCRLAEKHFPVPGKFLEVRSANGNFLVSMRNRGWDVQGVEVSVDGAELSRAAHGLRVFNGQLVQCPEDVTRFDFVVLWAVMPHIPNPVPTIKVATYLLAPGGRLIDCCCNIDSYAAEIMGSTRDPLDTPGHYYLWSPKTLGVLYEKVGLSVADFIHHDDIFDSNFVLPWLARIPQDLPFGLFLRVLLFPVRVLSGSLNTKLAAPVLAKACVADKGGFIAVVGER